MALVPASSFGGGGGGFTSLSDQTLGGAAASFSFPAISSGFTHLRLYMYARGDTAATNVQVNMRFNADSGANYDGERDAGFGAGISASGQGAQTSVIAGIVTAATASANHFGLIVVEIPFYTLTTGFHTWYGHCVRALDDTGANQAMDIQGGTYLSSTAISQIDLLAAAGNFIANSRAVLYGI